MTNKKISIIIPAYNTERYIEKCLDSISRQDYTDFEVILVDDCSTDRTPEIIQGYATKDDRFKFYRNDRNLGCGLTRRRAIELGTGEYFAFVDADDYIEPSFLSSMLEACLNTGSEIAICGVFNRDEDYNYLGQDIAEKQYTVAKEQLYREYMLSSWILQYAANKFYYRRVIDRVKYSDLRYCEDSTTTYKWLWEANQAVVIPRSMYHYIRHDDSNSNKNNEPIIKAYCTCLCIYDHYQFCRKQGFNYMFERLKNFARPHIAKCLFDLEDDDKRLNTILKIRDEMFG